MNQIHRSETSAVNAKILVIEDESEIRELICILLQRQGYDVTQCATAIEARPILSQKSFDLIVLDWMLPDLSGLDFLKAIKTENRVQTPVLMVTAKAEPTDVVAGLEAGADDYVTKPFEPSVLQARVRTMLRRSTALQSANQDLQRIGSLAINFKTYDVRCAGQQLHLTPSEFKILSTMAVNQGRVLTRDQLISIVQGEGITVTGRTIDTHVFGLRKKLGECADWIETVRGIGYRIKPEL